MIDIPTELHLRDVRCFHGVQKGQLRPITLLIGNNSTGKTTFLGCYSILHRLLSEIEITEPNFNNSPFSMGSFSDLVRTESGKSDNARVFKLGLKIEPMGDNPSYHTIVDFGPTDSGQMINSMRFEVDKDKFLCLSSRNDKTSVRVNELECQIPLPINRAMVLLFAFVQSFRDSSEAPDSPPGIRDLARLLHDQFPYMALDSFYGLKSDGTGSRFPFALLPKLVPFAPIRLKPERHYSTVSKSDSPAEGSHVPELLVNLTQSASEGWKALHEGLQSFGRRSGLFEDLDVKRLGARPSDPFQLQFRVKGGPFVNIIDVGYGVSQSLPILVEILATKQAEHDGDRMFLLQQPEVHLHPSGQAALASLFVDAFKEEAKPIPYRDSQ